MTDDAISPSDCTRAAARRNQILTLPKPAFASMAFMVRAYRRYQILRHERRPHLSLLREQEAIIAAIVAGDLDRLLNMTAQMRAADDIPRGHAGGRVGQGVIDNLDPSVAGLELEIAAEHRATRMWRTSCAGPTGMCHQPHPYAAPCPAGGRGRWTTWKFPPWRKSS